MPDSFEGWRVTAHCRPIYSFGHNMRLPDYVETQTHIDPTRNHDVLLHLGTEQEAYQAVFGDAIKKYNAKQKRKDRRITDYYQKVLDDERRGKHKNPKASSERKPFYEFQFYFGRRDSHCPDEKAKQILSLYIKKVLPKKFPNFIPVNIVMHNDEYSFDRKGNRMESPLHYHVVGVFVAHALTSEELKAENDYRAKFKEAKKAEIESSGEKWNEELWNKKDWRKDMIERWGKSLEKGMELQSSMSAACNEMGFFTSKGKGTAQQQFEEAVRHELMDFAESLGIKVNRTKGYSHSHREKEIYASEQNNMDWDAELKEKEELLEAKNLELQNQKDDFDYTIEHLEELEQELTNQKIALQKREEQLHKDIADLEKREEKLVSEKAEINLQNREQEYIRKILNEKETKLSRKEKDLDYRLEKFFEKERVQNGREKRILQGEAPLIEKERELKKIEKKISEKEKLISQKENDLNALSDSISKREKLSIEKEASAIKKLSDAENEKLAAASERQAMEYFVKKNNEKILDIQNWGTELKVTNNAEAWIKSEALEYKKNRFKENALSKFVDKIIGGVKSVVANLKQTYESKVNELSEKLFGRKKFYTKDDKIICEYSYGEHDYAEMLRDTPVADIQKAVDEAKRLGTNTFAEAAQAIGGAAFYERNFKKAKALTRERNLEMERMRSRSISR